MATSALAAGGIKQLTRFRAVPARPGSREFGGSLSRPGSRDGIAPIVSASFADAFGLVDDGGMALPLPAADGAGVPTYGWRPVSGDDPEPLPSLRSELNTGRSELSVGGARGYHR